MDRSHKGSRLPDLGFHASDGKTLRLPSLTGKPLLVNFWATWCGPCVAELPTLHQLAGTQAGKITVLAVSEDLGDPAKVGAFWQAHGLAGWPQSPKPWLDPDNDATSQYALQTMPTTIYYDAAGREVWRYTGGRDWASKDTAALLAEAH